jgi:hypothetical protein
MTLLYRCLRTFDELEGTDRVQRRCSGCRLDVVDFRSLTPVEQEQYLALAEIAQEEVCAVLPANTAGIPACDGHPESTRSATASASAVGRVDLRSAAQKRWDEERAAVTRHAPNTIAVTTSLAAMERRAAVAREDMRGLLARVRGGLAKRG